MWTAHQEHRPFEVQIAGLQDEFFLRGGTLVEQLGRPYVLTLDMLSHNPNVPFASVINQNAQVRVQLPSAPGKHRYIHGCVRSFNRVGSWQDAICYEAVVVPHLWNLSCTSDCRIFPPGLSAPEIIKSILDEAKIVDVEMRLREPHVKREYCVQYRESDLDFICRLMEEEGMYYYFLHSEDKYEMIIVDSAKAHEPVAGYERAVIRTDGMQSLAEFEVVLECSIGSTFNPSVYVHKDYDFTSPKKNLTSTARLPHDYDTTPFEVFNWPGCYKDLSQGETLANVRIQELNRHSKVYRGKSNIRGMACGCRMVLMPDNGQEDMPILITSCKSQFHNSDVESETNPRYSNRPEYEIEFTGIDAEAQFRLARTTRRPIVSGPQTAVVVGPEGEEIWTDEYGRVKVQFHWDRRGRRNQDSSCWIRVAQVWAGKNWGAMYIPRVGQEVIVDFLEGDPDQPIVIGRIYNGDQMPPNQLPQNRMMSTLKSSTTPGGSGFNEISFNDEKGKELLFIHAQRNADVRVGNDYTDTTKRDRHETVGRDRKSLTKGDLHSHVNGSMNQKVAGTISVQAGMEMHEKVGTKKAVQAGQEIHLKAGMKVVLEAGVQLTIKAAGGFIDIGPAGITIQGTIVKINSGGAAGSGSGASPEAPAPPQDAQIGKPGGLAKLLSAGAKIAGTSRLAGAFKRAAAAGNAFVEMCKK